MRYCIEETDAAGAETTLFGAERGCAEFEQRLLRFAGPSAEHVNAADDEVFYVLAGTGRATFGDDDAALRPGTAAYVARGTSWRVDEADGLQILSVLGVFRPAGSPAEAYYPDGAPALVAGAAG